MTDIDRIIAYESGEMDFDEMVNFFQSLIDSEVVWHLQGHYGRTARDLIEGGFCTPAVAHA